MSTTTPWSEIKHKSDALPPEERERRRAEVDAQVKAEIEAWRRAHPDEVAEDERTAAIEQAIDELPDGAKVTVENVDGSRTRATKDRYRLVSDQGEVLWPRRIASLLGTRRKQAPE